MTDAQKFNIPLDSPLDVNANDMFINAAQPMFLYNRQKYQGQVLQNSVRYEDYGWFAGWWGHKFPQLTIGDFEIAPPISGPSPEHRRFLRVQTRSLTNGSLLFTLTHQDIGLRFRFTLSSVYTILVGADRTLQVDNTLTRVNDTTVRIQGRTTKSDMPNVEVDYNIYTLQLLQNIIPLPPDWSQLMTESDFIYRYEVGPITVIGNDFYVLRLSQLLEIENVQLSYKYDNNMHTWFYGQNDHFYISNDIVTSSGVEFIIVNQNHVDIGLDTEHYTIDVRNSSVWQLQTYFDQKVVWQRVLFSSAKAQQEYMAVQGRPVIEDLRNKIEVRMVWSDNKFAANTQCIIYFALPVWQSVAPVNMYFNTYAVRADGAMEAADGTIVEATPEIVNIELDPIVFNGTLPEATNLETITFDVTSYDGLRDMLNYERQMKSQYFSMCNCCNVNSIDGEYIDKDFIFNDTLPDSSLQPIRNRHVEGSGLNDGDYELIISFFDKDNNPVYLKPFDIQSDLSNALEGHKPIEGITNPGVKVVTKYNDDYETKGIDKVIRIYSSKEPGSPPYQGMPRWTTDVMTLPLIFEGVDGQKWYNATNTQVVFQDFTEPSYIRAEDWDYFYGSDYPMPKEIINKTVYIPQSTTEYPELHYTIEQIPTRSCALGKNGSVLQPSMSRANLKRDWARRIQFTSSAGSTQSISVQYITRTGWLGEITSSRDYLPAVKFTDDFVYTNTSGGDSVISNSVGPIYYVQTDDSLNIFWPWEGSDGDGQGSYPARSVGFWLMNRRFPSVNIPSFTAGWRTLPYTTPVLYEDNDPNYTATDGRWSSRYYGPTNIWGWGTVWNWHRHTYYFNINFSIDTLVLGSYSRFVSGSMDGRYNWNGWRIGQPQAIFRLWDSWTNFSDQDTGPPPFRVSQNLYNELRYTNFTYAAVSGSMFYSSSTSGSISNAVGRYWQRVIAFKGYAYIVVSILNDDILRSNVDSFTVREISNNEIKQISGITIPSSDVRIDSNGGEYTTGVMIEPAVGSTAVIRRVDQNMRQLLIPFQSVGEVPFFMLVKSPPSTGYPPSVYGNWYDFSDSWSPVFANLDDGFSIVLSFRVQTGIYLQSPSSNQSMLNVTPFNNYINNLVRPQYVLDPVTIPVGQPSVLNNDVVQHVKIQISPTAYTIIDWYPLARAYRSSKPQNKTDVYTDLNYTLVSSQFVGNTRPYVDPPTFTLQLSYNGIQTFELWPTLLLETNGSLLPVDFKIVAQEGQLVSFEPDGYGVFNTSTLRIEQDPWNIVFVNTTQVDLRTIVYVNENNHFTIEFTPEGILYRDPTTITYQRIEPSPRNPEWYNLYFTYPYGYQGPNYVMQVDTTFKSVIDFEICDIRTNEMKQVYSREISDVKMFVKQFWSSTVFTENYWTIDNNYVLELTQEDLILWKKTPYLHDWMGDRWEIDTYIHTYVDGSKEVRQKKVPRSQFIGTADLYYSVSSAYNDIPYFFKLQEIESNLVQLLYISDIREDYLWDTSDPVWNTSQVIRISVVDFGTFGASPQDLVTYTALNASGLISKAKISATVVNHARVHIFLLGIAYSRGLQQWTIKLVNGTRQSTIWGYGHVGHDGTLTGGQIPKIACGTTGFNRIVRRTTELIDIKSIPSGCYGAGNTVWFLYKNIKTIVSHMILYENNYSHEPIEIDLNNNVVTNYQSESFISNAIYDVAPQFITISQLLGSNNDILGLLSGIFLPSIIAIDARWAILGHISHSLGQYAYVYHNSVRDVQDEKITDIDIGFGKSEYNISLSMDQVTISSFWFNLIMKGVQMADAAFGDVWANKVQNQTTTEDGEGRKFSQFSMDNIAGAIGSAIQSSESTITLKSTISFIYTLGMFYSISDKAQCWAGPGFVNHNFIAQCLAQSVTSNKTEGRRVNYWLPFKSISEALVDIRTAILKVTRDSLAQYNQGLAASSVSGTSTGTGFLLSPGLYFLVTSMDALIIFNDMGKNIINGLYDSLGGSSNDSAGRIHNEKPYIEYPHNYGNKPMSFFWPAFGVYKPITYTNELVDTTYAVDKQNIDLGGNTIAYSRRSSSWTLYDNDTISDGVLKGPLASVQVLCQGIAEEVLAPDNMAVVEGTTSFLSTQGFKNEQVNMTKPTDNIGNSAPTFPPPAIHDYEVDKFWSLGVTAGAGEIIAVTCDDTKLLDGAPSNIVVSPTYCFVSSPYAVVEVKNTYDSDYLRPVAITPTAVGLNINRINCVHEGKAYHAFDGQSSRIVNWKGNTGMAKDFLYQHYLFQINDHFKRSSIYPPNQFFGSFDGPPAVAIRSYEKVGNFIQALGKQEGLDNNVPGENKNLQRFSIPVHSETLSTLPAVIRTLAPYKLHVVEGITSLTTDIRYTQTAYKAPSSVDFSINGIPYRATQEYICEINQQMGIIAVSDIVASAGLTFIGATTRAAYFYSPATKMYYSFSGQREITKIDILNRFSALVEGKWDFVNQEVVFKAYCKDDILICRIDNGVVTGEVFPPNETIYNKVSDFKMWSMAGGFVFQGPNRFIVNRYVILDHMYEGDTWGSLRINNRYPLTYTYKPGDKRWKRVSRYEWDQKRDYGWHYETVNAEEDFHVIWGWSHNPFGLATDMLGVDPEADNRSEWELTFEWTEAMDKLYEPTEYVTVNIKADTVTQGGMLKSEVTHLYLNKELFNRSGNVGYYTFQFQSNNGSGNRERLYIWSDAVIALSDMKLNCKNITVRRTQPLTIQQDVQQLTEF